VLLALLAACQVTPEPEPARPKPSLEEPEPGLPAGFEVKGTPLVELLTLPPDAAWRFVVSHLTTLRADARAAGADLLVTFQADAVHVTDREGGRRTWRLPAGIRLGGVPAHLRLGADLSTAVYDAKGAQVPAADEITVVTARLGGPDGGTEEYRLVIKGGHAFRSISTSG
jgi:hypothetical protein